MGSGDTPESSESAFVRPRKVRRCMCSKRSEPSGYVFSLGSVRIVARERRRRTNLRRIDVESVDRDAESFTQHVETSTAPAAQLLNNASQMTATMMTSAKRLISPNARPIRDRADSLTNRKANRRSNQIPPTPIVIKGHKLLVA